MIAANLSDKKPLQLSLYGGITLILISMLFLGRGQESASFLVQAITVLAAPAFFYLVGVLVYRHLNAPLAAPGIIATGAWLIGVGLIHLYDKRGLMPVVLQPYYWLGASLLAATLITLTGHRVRIWMLVLLVPLTQVNAMWAIMGALGLSVEWMPPLCFALVLLWWELPLQDTEWVLVYRVSAVCLAVFLLVFSAWLPAPTARTMMLTWGAGGVLVAVLGLRHGWVKLGPLAIAMMTCATAWGLPASWWPPVWLTFAAGTIIFIERLTTRHDKDEEKDPKGRGVQAVQMSEALAIVLSAASALLAQAGPLMNVPIHPLGTAGVLLGAGFLMAWLGVRRNLLLATHLGLWLVASGWGSLYFYAIPTSGTFGLWLALFASCALFAERLLTSRREKQKDRRSLLQTMAFWPLADLVIGLSALVVLWAALEINSASPWVLTVTISITIGLWIAAGLIYRLPVLLHIALWLAPLPYALLLILLAPSIWTLPLLGVAWQILGLSFVMLGHSLPRYRPAMLAPFFVTGYGLLAFGLTMAMPSPLLMPVTLLLVITGCLVSTIAVIADRHPAWNVFAAWLVQAEKRPYAYRNLQNLFLILTAWFSAIWLHLMLSSTSMSLPQQGLCLVLFSCAWFLLGAVLRRLPTVLAWPLVSAGWMMWSIGLVEVFFSRPEALVTVIVGLVISGEALRRSRHSNSLYTWIPIFIVQVFFTALQFAWLFTLPGRTVLLLVGAGISVGGMAYERTASVPGRLAAATGGAMAIGITFLFPGLDTFVIFTGLTIVATLVYRRWQLLWAVYAGSFLIGVASKIVLSWQVLLALGLVQCLIGAELILAVRPRRFHTFVKTFLNKTDWATPFLTIGTGCIVVALFKLTTYAETLSVLFLLTATTTAYTFRFRMRRLPYLPILLAWAAVVTLSLHITSLPFAQIGTPLMTLSVALALAALAFYWSALHLLHLPESTISRFVWWIRPLLKTSYFLGGVSLIMLLVLGPAYPVSPALLLLNGMLLVLYGASAYLRQRREFWVWTTLAIAGYCWAFLLETLHLNHLLWQTIPMGLTLLAAARFTRNTFAEFAGTFILIAGSALSLDRTTLVALPTFVLAVHLLALVAYGYIGGRRVPFVSGVALLTGGLLFTILKIDVWLIPLVGGLLLIGGALFVETQHTLAETWLSRWLTHWQAWE